MSEEHTMKLEYLGGGMIIDNEGETLRFESTASHDEKANYIVNACNSHADREAVIDGLVKALELMVKQFIAYTPQFKHDDRHAKCWELIEARAALAAAKEKK